jgi:hypothetical protein
MAKAATPKKPAPKKVPTPKPEASGAKFYRAKQDFSHIVEGGEKRAEKGHVIVIDGGSLDIYPPERFVEAYPDVALADIPEG